MKDAPNSQTDVNGFAVIRKYEPTRIERELLAQVFEVLSHGRGHRSDELNRLAVATLDGTSEVAVDAKLQRGLFPIEVAQRDSLEPAA